MAFCAVRSQVKGEIVLQSRPLGQQMTDLLLLKGMHVVLEGQQKLEGMPAWLQGDKPAAEQVLACLGRRPTA